MTPNFQFPLNDYTIEYFDFLENATIPTEYFERHHIYPKSIFGDNNILQKLSFGDHFKAHRLLVKIYEAAGMKREYMQMAKAFFQFVHISNYKKRCLIDISDEDIEELASLITEAKIENRKSSVGELNGFYGQHHSPETIAKILETKKSNGKKKTPEMIADMVLKMSKRDPDDVAKNWYHDIDTHINTRFSNNFIKLNGVPDNHILGRYTPDDVRLRQSFRMKEVSETLSFDWIKRGEDNYWTGSKHITNPSTGENRRIFPDDVIPEGFVEGLQLTPEWLENMRIAGEKRRGIPQPHVQLINRDPEKIRKTAEWHTGKKRSDEAKANMSTGHKKYFENGGESGTKGKCRLFNVLTRKYGYFLESDVTEALSNGYTNEKTFKVKNKDGKHIYITDSEQLPDGYAYAPNAGKRLGSSD